MKAINKGFLEKVFPLEQVRFAFTLKHIDKYKHYYSVNELVSKHHNHIEPFQESLLNGFGAECQRCQGLPSGKLPSKQETLPCH
jgi:hypothetical protein